MEVRNGGDEPGRGGEGKVFQAEGTAHFKALSEEVTSCSRNWEEAREAGAQIEKASR